MSKPSVSMPRYEDVEAAAARLAGAAVRTPLVESPALSDRVGGRVFLKLETLQRTGSFKFRGAYNRLVQLGPDERARGVVAFSSGNHAQGVAAAAALLEMAATIVMPRDAPRAKIEGTRSYGAKIVFYDRARENREAIAAVIAKETGATLVPSFDDPHIVAGQGTVGLEIADAAHAAGADFDAVLVPCSGGGLVSGVALGLSRAQPDAAIYSVEPELYDGARLSLALGVRTAASGGRPTMADALMTTMPGTIPFAIMQTRLAGGFAVSDPELARAVQFAVRSLKLVLEPGGAAALAALLSGAFDARRKTVAVVLSGANVDSAILVNCLGGSES